MSAGERDRETGECSDTCAEVHRAIQEASWATGVAMLDSDLAAFRRAVLALPEVAALRAKAAAADRVREVLDRADRRAARDINANAIRRALDGEHG